MLGFEQFGKGGAYVPTDRSARPLLAVYVVHHPDFALGERIAGLLQQHFRRDTFTSVAGGAGVDVLSRSAPRPGSPVPIDIDLDDADAIAVVVLIDNSFIASSAFVDYAEEIAARVEARGLTSRVFPVTIDGHAPSRTLGAIQHLDWAGWAKLGEALQRRRLVTELTHQMCRMLRQHLSTATSASSATEDIAAFLEPVRIFLSHSKHDEVGGAVAAAVRDALRESGNIATFFDCYDIPAGLDFARVLEAFAQRCAMLVIQSDSYASRTWCRREVLLAKRYDVPIVVSNSVSNFEERGFPYMGNVPLVRLEPTQPLQQERIWLVIGRVLDEMLKCYLWRSRVRQAGPSADGVVFLPRPPEMVKLCELMARQAAGPPHLIVYPDPPLGVEETELLETMSPGTALKSFKFWLTERNT